MLHDLPRNGRHSVVVSVEDEDEEGREVTITPTADPSKFEVEVMPPFLDEEEEPQTMSVGDIARLLQRYDVAEVARLGTGEDAVHFRRNRQNLLGKENQARVRARRFAPKPPRYDELPTGQGVVTDATNWGFRGGVDWEDSPVYLNANVDPRNMHVRHVIPYEIIEGEIKRGRQENPFNRTRFEIGQVKRVVFPFTKEDVHKIIVRVLGVDSPEMNSKDPVVKEWAVKARNRMLSLLAPGVFEVDGSYTRKDIIRLLKENVAIIWLDVQEYDKYGRTLANIYYSPEDTETIQSKCIKEGFSKPYFGKTKQQWVAEDCKQLECA